MSQLVRVTGTTSSFNHPTPTPTPTAIQDDDDDDEGVAANIKLLLKLVEDYEKGCNSNDGATLKMLSILDSVRSRILQGSSSKEIGGEKLEVMRLKKEVKCVKMMCNSLGKEKGIIAGELSKKVQQLSGMEEVINDLRTQNQWLIRRLNSSSIGSELQEGKCTVD